MDNKSYLNSPDYDSDIRKVIPYYDEIHEQIINLVKTFDFKDMTWLDTGCGSGSFAVKAIENFNISRMMLCDPSEKMLSVSKSKLEKNNSCNFKLCSSQELDFNEEFDVVSAVQSHHYLDINQRKIAIEQCYKALKDNGVFITFENFAPFTERGKEIVLKRIENYGISHGRSLEDVTAHSARYNKEFFPIKITDHLNLLKSCGFKVSEVFWVSYMQAGFYGIK